MPVLSGALVSRPHEKVRPPFPFAASLCTAASCIGLLAIGGCGSNTGISSAALPSETGASAGNGSGVISQSKLGYAWLTEDGTLRPLLGVMGAAYLGESLTAPRAYVAGAASALSQVALLVGADGGITRMSLPDGALTSAGVTSGTGAAKIRLSPSGSAAVIFVPGATTAVLLTSLRSSMQSHTLTAGNPLKDAAVSDAGSVAALLQVQSKAIVSVLHTDGSTAQVATLSGPGDLGFVGSGDDLLTVDSAANRLVLTHTVSTSPNPLTVNTSGLLKSPIAVGAAVTGRWAVAVNSADSSVVRVDLTGQVAPQRIVCPTQPLFAEPLAYGAFRFSDAGSSPAWVTDITASLPTMFFVPALPPPAVAGL